MDAYIELLTEQHTLADELGALSSRQGELIGAGGAEAILEVLSERQRVMDRILANQDRLAALDKEYAAGPLESRRQRIRELTDSLVSRLGEILRRDERDRAALQARRDAAGADLGGLGTARRARRAYFDARRVGNRFADREG